MLISINCDKFYNNLDSLEEWDNCAGFVLVPNNFREFTYWVYVLCTSNVDYANRLYYSSQKIIYFYNRHFYLSLHKRLKNRTKCGVIPLLQDFDHVVVDYENMNILITGWKYLYYVNNHNEIMSNLKYVEDKINLPSNKYGLTVVIPSADQ